MADRQGAIKCGRRASSHHPDRSENNTQSKSQILLQSEKKARRVYHVEMNIGGMIPS